MGLIRMLGDVVGAGLQGVEGTLNSAMFREYFTSGDMSGGVIMRRGQKVLTDKGRNRNSDDNLISSGSVIDVQPNQCMIIIDSGKIVDMCTEQGQYRYDASTAPSFFVGENHSIKALGKEILNQWSAGGQRMTTQRVYFINMGELMDTPIKWGGGNFNFHHTTMMRNGTPPIEVDMSLKGNGTLTVRVAEPHKFFMSIGAQKVGGDNGGLIRITDDGMLETLKSCIIDKVALAIETIGWENPIPYTAIRANGALISECINKNMGEEWASDNGFEVCKFNVNGSFTPDPDSMEQLKNLQSSFNMSANMNAANYDIQKTIASGVKAAGENGGASGLFGIGMGMGAVGGGNLGQMQQQPMNQFNQNQNPYQQNPYPQQNQNPYPQQQAPAQQPVQQPAPQQTVVAAPIIDVGEDSAEDKWTCECGQECTGKFCFNCGAKKPEPKPASNGAWVCACGNTNTGKFCPNCGTKKPEKKVLKCDKCGWTAPEGVTGIKFCPECGDIVNESDFQ